MCGNTVAARLSRYAAPVPSPISVNIFGLRFARDIQKRSKNGQPPHNTAGVASTNSIQLRAAAENGSRNQCAPMSITSSGIERAALTHNLRDMLSYSGSAAATADTSTG